MDLFAKVVCGYGPSTISTKISISNVPLSFNTTLQIANHYQLKENSDIFSNFIFENLNDSISHSVFPSALKLANTTPVQRKVQNVKKIITDPSVAYQIYLKYMKGFSLNKFQNILNNFFPNINVDSEKVSVHNIICYQCLRNGISCR